MLKKHRPLGAGMAPSETKLGRFLRTHRLELGLTQAEMAKFLKIEQNSYSNFETGKRPYLKNKQLQCLVKALKYDPTELKIFVSQTARPKTELAKLIRSRMEQLGLTLQDFAKRIGTSQHAKYFLEGNRQSISYGSLKSLAKALKLETVSLSKFLSPRKQVSSDLGQLVRSRRRELGLSIIELGKELGVSRQAVNQIEFGRFPLSRSDAMIKRLASVLKLDVAKLQTVRPKRRLRREIVEFATLGGFLTARRQELGLTQSELARRAQTSQTKICLIERGENNLNRMRLAKISKALRCQIPAELIPK